MLRVLGLDPGLARTGVAVVEGAPGALRLVEADCVVTAPADGAQRLVMLHDAVLRLVECHRPDAAAVEELFFATNRRSAMRVSEARGVMVCALARAGVAVSSYTPLQVKGAVAGYGAADKLQVARMTLALLGVEEIAGPDDVTDACAVAICHHHRARLGARLRPLVAPRPAGVSTPRLAAAVEAARAAGEARPR